MKRRKILKRTFAIFSIVLMLSVFALNVFAYSVPVAPEDGGYTFNEDNVLTYANYSAYHYTSTGVNVISTRDMGYCAYYAPSSPIQITHRFIEPITLEAGNTYVLFWFILSAPDHFSARDFRVFDGQQVFSRDVNMYPFSVQGLSLNGESIPCYYNLITVHETKTIYSLGCEFSYNDENKQPIVFLPFLVQLNDTTTYYIGEGLQLVFYNNSDYIARNAQFTPSQFTSFLTIQNDTVYNFDSGYNLGFDKGIQDKNVYGEQQRSEGFEDGRNYQKQFYQQDLTNARLEGYENGKRDGLNSGGLNLKFKTLVFTVLQSPFNVARTIFNFEFLEINLAGFFFSVITLIVCVRLIKHFV